MKGIAGTAFMRVLAQMRRPLREIKKPLSLAALRGVARDGSLPVGLGGHALGKYDSAHGGADSNECDHAFSVPSLGDECQTMKMASHDVDSIVHGMVLPRQPN